MALQIVFLLSIMCALCNANSTAVTQKAEHRDGTTIEIAVVISGIVAASTIAILAVLLPTIIYYNYRKEDSDIPVSIH